MFERHNQPLADIATFIKRLIIHTFMGSSVFIIALGVGIAGYHRIAKLPFIDSFMNAAMVLCGMGQIDIMHTTIAKLFAGIYALFCGLMFAAALALLIAPMIHRLLHKFHLDKEA